MSGFLGGFAVAYLGTGFFMIWHAIPGAVIGGPVRVPAWAWMVTAMLAVLIWPHFLIKAMSK